jgi:hypothetical protein
MAVHGSKVWYYTGDESLQFESTDGSQRGELYGIAFLHELKDRNSGKLKYKLFVPDASNPYDDCIWLKNATGRVVAVPRNEHYKAQVDFANEAGASSPFFWPSAAEIEAEKGALAVKAEIGQKTMQALAKKKKESQLVREMLSTSLSPEAIQELNRND